jgi:hypothetical protein
MRFRGFFAFFLAGMALSGLWTEESAETGPPPAPEAFPILPLLLPALNGEVPWRPDWPPDIPPDAFSARGNIRSITLDLEGGTITLSRGTDGRPEEYPCLFNGNPVQVKAAYDDSGGLKNIGAELPESAALSVDIPAGDFPPAEPLTVKIGETFCFVALFETASAISETWYDPEGNFLGFYRALFSPGGRIRSLESLADTEKASEDYFFDSGGNVTRIFSGRGDFTALYRNGVPQYRSRAPGEIDSFQWDQAGFLVRVVRTGAENRDFRYEYEHDGRGNWIIRRETEFVPYSTLLVPGQYREINRSIVYWED